MHLALLSFCLFDVLVVAPAPDAAFAASGAPDAACVCPQGNNGESNFCCSGWQ